MFGLQDALLGIGILVCLPIFGVFAQMPTRFSFNQLILAQLHRRRTYAQILASEKHSKCEVSFDSHTVICLSPLKIKDVSSEFDSI